VFPGIICGRSRNFHLQRRHKSCGLGQRFLVFRLGVGIGHNAGADVKMYVAIFANRCADGDAQLAFAIETEIAVATAVRPARDGFEFVNNFHRAEFGCAGDAAAGKT